MAKRSSRVIFPWEERRTWLGSLGRTRLRMFALLFLALGFLVLLRKREEAAASTRATRASITTAIRGVIAYRADHAGACPKTWREVVGAGALRDVPQDSWGMPLRLVCPGRADPKGFEVLSDGPDKLPYGLDRVW
jgi:general secretion pathway protein G